MSSRQAHIENMNYHSDRRVRAMEAESLFENFDESAMTAEYIYETDEGDEVTEQVHMRFEVCDLCDGRGKVANPSIDCGGLTREDFDEDPDFRESYMSGRYDISCPQCHGKRVHAVLDERATQPELLTRIQTKQREDAAFARECAAERMMGA